MKTLTDFIFLSSKITADSDCSHEIKWCSLLGRKSVTNLDTLPTKVSLVKVMVFSVVTCGYEIWTIKKAERWRIDAFTCGAGEDSWESFGQQQDQTSHSQRKSTLNIHWEDWCWSWNSNTLATWCEELTHWKRPWCWERFRARAGGDRGWDG